MSEEQVSYGLNEPRIRIKGRRVDLGLTAEQLGSMVGLSRTQIGRIENGQRDATVWEALRIAKALRRRIDELFIEP